jgi:hypothetical protein
MVITMCAAADSRQDTGSPVNAPSGVDRDEAQNENWVKVLAPELEAGEEKRLVVWGRFWGISDEQAAAFFLLLEPAENKTVALRLAVYGSQENLVEYNPRLEYPDFERRILEYSVSDSPVPTVTLNQIRDRIEAYIAKSENIDQLENLLSSENETEFYNWNKELVSQIISKGKSVFQVRGQLVGKQKLKAKSSDVKQTQLENGKTIPVNFVYSPGESVPAGKLREGMPVYVRVTGEAVKKLPEGMRDRQSPEKSVPLLGWVFEIDNEPKLPADFDGEPADYKEVTVELNSGIYGRGFVFKEDRIKIDSKTPEADVLPEDLIRILALLGLLVLIFLLLVYAG